MTKASGKDFRFGYAVEQNFIQIQKQVIRVRQKQREAQNWNNYVKSSTDYKINSDQNCTEIEHSKSLLNKGTMSQLYSLHDPYNINIIHGLRNRLFKTFREFHDILINTLSPPVLKIRKKVKIKIKESEEQSSINYIADLNLLLTEIKKESKNENLHTKKNKTNDMLKNRFQMKIIQCYKLAIDTIQICSKSLEAGTANPIQSKMKNLIQIISTLSLITGKYLYGELFKKKKKESYDLVQQCKDLGKMLDECGYKDKDNDNDNDSNIQSNTLNELASKSLLKNKIQSFSSKYKLDMYNVPTKTIGSNYAQKWSKKSLESTKDMENRDRHSCNRQMAYEQPISLKNHQNLCSHDTKNKPDEIKTEIENLLYDEEKSDKWQMVYEQPISLKEHQTVCSDSKTKTYEIKTKIEDLLYDEEIDNYCEETKNKNNVCTFGVTNLPTATKTIKLNNNVGLFIMKENPWRNFPVKNTSISQNGCLRLYVPPNDLNDILSYRKKLQPTLKSTLHGYELDTIFKVSESILDDLIKEVVLKMEHAMDNIIYELFRQELQE